MADVMAAITYVLSWEDATLSGKVTVDGGGRTRFGIAEKYHPELTASLFYTSMGCDAALKLAEGVYVREYAEPLCIAQLRYQAVANKLLSLGVNCGVSVAAKMLQNAVNVNGDGRIGPLTLAATDDAAPERVLASLRSQASARYEEVAQDNPDDAKYLAGWLRRARA
jgi:lysozyme family protein